MADRLTSLEWDPAPAREAPALRLAPAASTANGAARDEGFAKLARDAFSWPTPPYASYPVGTPQTDPLPCEIVGHNGTRTAGRLTFFVPDDGVAHVQLPPARTTLPLRFEQFRALHLSTPLTPVSLSFGEPHADLLGHRARSSYQLVLADGSELSGETIGHVENDWGLFLFPPCLIPATGAPQADGSVTRSFVPRCAYTRFDAGARIGELLVEQHSATRAQIEQAVSDQQALRERKLGDLHQRER